ncbi:ubiquitin C-terminal hydrolase 13 [Gossypium raimondii]|uniref:ubiquitinyl hydrolase 1 n=2 Tax=Gossypium raimondii TaxID=29730 RepID=A0A0D2TC48_GOSRA|nr:ubiquitin C-terminal hydrolase 13 [Gossypium raimondii]KJB73303.1 hypothetical protein B456_011G226800 [Gossypium raimondii]KJB73306.1 hypothetical protein B456_011G226800 [Gossypium raimondii]
MTLMTPPPLDQEDDEMLVPHNDFVDGPQPLEVAKEAASKVDAQAVDDPPSGRFTWTIENFSRLNTKKLYSDIFFVGGYKWRILIFPKGNNVDHLSMYLDVADSATLPYGWSRYAQFSLAVCNQIHNKYTIRKDTQHQFNVRESDWGFTSFMPLGELYDPSRGFLVNDTCVVEADVAVRKVADYWSHDSKKETGYVGLKNQGATCYMNSLLQTLYHIPYFRKAVYHMPTTENDMPTGSIPLALQSLFYKLQYSDTSVATKELTKSFGWDTYDSFMQHDVQELNRVLCEKLEDKMKGTVVEGTIQQLFEGHHMNYIECINVDYKSTRKESFYDLQLDVKGCKDVYASFDKYVEVECLEGDNRYHAEQFGLQDARKGVLFIDFPPVLQLQLKRFEYDFMRDTMVKINDRYEFPLQLDLDREDGKYLSPEADRSVRNLYTLHSVLVHSGGVHGGHYYAYIRPTLSDQWFKFDDERVTKEDVKRALEEQYGGEEELPQTNPGFNNTPFKFTKYSNAYMLVYIRESDKDKIICNVDEKDIAEHLRIRLKKEQEEKEQKRKEKAEAHLYTVIKVARNEDLVEQIGRDIYFDLVDHEKVRSFRIQKQMPFNVFKEEVAKEFGIPVQYQRFWLWAKRQNHTYRPNRPLTYQEEAQSVGQLREVSNKANNAELKLFLEVELGPDLQPVPPPEKTKEDILLFFKLYDPVKEELRYIGRMFVKGAGKPMEILARINKMAGFGPDEEIELYEEIKFEPNVMCEHIDKKLTFRTSQLEDGDIICLQKYSEVASEQCRYPDVPSFLEYVHNRQVVRFRSLEKPKEDEFSLELSKLHNYDDVVERVAHHLGLDDPSKIRLTSHNCYSQQPKPQPIKYRGVEHLSDMLIHYNQTSDILYYEVLDIPLPELQGLKTLKVAFHHATKDEVVIHTIRLPKQSTVGDVLDDLKTKVELSHPGAELRLLEVFYHKIYKIFPLSEKIENINDQYWTLRAEEIPEEEKDLGPHDRLIHVYHFMKDTTQNQQVQNFGEPFFLVIHETETLAEVKVRVQKRLQVPDEEFAKWKFAFLSLGRPEYLQDSDVVSTRFQRRDVYGAWDQYLGLEHSDNAPKRSYAANQNRHTFEKPVKIYN